MVRAISDPHQRNTIRLSFVSALAAAALALVGWFAMRPVAPAAVELRTLTDVNVTWVCALNPAHQFEAPGRFEPRRCRECDGKCDILLRYVCLEHKEEFEVLARFEREASSGDTPGAERIARYRYRTARDWIASHGEVRCPVPDCTAPTRRPHTAWTERMIRDNRRRPPLP